MDEYYTQEDYPGLLMIVYILNIVAWFRVTDDFWFSLIMGNATFFIGYMIYLIGRTVWN